MRVPTFISQPENTETKKITRKNNNEPEDQDGIDEYDSCYVGVGQNGDADDLGGGDGDDGDGDGQAC